MLEKQKICARSSSALGGTACHVEGPAVHAACGTEWAKRRATVVNIFLILGLRLFLGKPVSLNNKVQFFFFYIAHSL